MSVFSLIPSLVTQRKQRILNNSTQQNNFSYSKENLVRFSHRGKPKILVVVCIYILPFFHFQVVNYRAVWVFWWGMSVHHYLSPPCWPSRIKWNYPTTIFLQTITRWGREKVRGYLHQKFDILIFDVSSRSRP